MPDFLIVLLIIAAVVGAIVYSVRMARKRREAMAALAASLGFRFEPANDASVDEQYRFLGRLKQGANRYAFNRMTGDYRGHAVDVFDYHYETYSHSKRGRRTHHHYFSFFILHVADYFPELTISHEHLFAKIGQFLGFDDIDFESAEFSDAFSVKSKDKKFAYDICHARTMEFLLANRDLSIEIDAHCLSLFFGQRLAPERIRPNLDRLVKLRELIPDYVLQAS
jgi:hypothetical protein